MLLSDLFDQLTYGELSQLNMGGVDGEIGIEPCDYPRVLPHINLGLTELYKRFPLKVNEVVIQQYDHINQYFLNSKFAQTNTESEAPYKYIMDSEYQPFQDDVLRIEKVFNEQGEELYLNQEDGYYAASDKYWSVFTPTFDSVQIPYPDSANQFIVTYRAGHPKININDIDLVSTEVHISAAYLEPLLNFIAARVYTNLTSLEGNEGQIYMQRFEMNCKKLEELNLFNKTETENSRLDNNGWV